MCVCERERETEREIITAVPLNGAIQLRLYFISTTVKKHEVMMGIEQTTTDEHLSALITKVRGLDRLIRYVLGVVSNLFAFFQPAPQSPPL